MIARIALEDGTIFTGESIGAAGTRTGEAVFNTSMTGYQEIFTDPSYCGQIVTMTFPLLGNYGVNSEDWESGDAHLSGVVLRELPRRPSNYRSEGDLRDYLVARNVVGVSGVDTRALTRRVREAGALRAAISTELGEAALAEAARNAPSMIGADLVSRVSPSAGGEWTAPLWESGAPAESFEEPRPHVAVVDCGAKRNILRHLRSCGCKVTAVPADAGAGAIRGVHPDGIVVSNGPGDPAAVSGLVGVLRGLIGEYPLLGICLGHQLLALALGARTYKLPFGHHGGNLPVLNRETGQVEITSQNHGFAVEGESLEQAGAVVSHVNLNDGTIEGFRHEGAGVQGVQFHPEASPGPHDAAGLFGRFVERVVRAAGRRKAAAS